MIGCYLKFTMRREERRLSNGLTYEPQTHYEKNKAVLKMEVATVHTLSQSDAENKCMARKAQAA
jgi:hypothetical protein